MCRGTYICCRCRCRRRRIHFLLRPRHAPIRCAYPPAVPQGAVGLALHSIAAAGLGPVANIDIHTGCCSEWRPAATPTLVVANPPWGLRLPSDGGDRGVSQGRAGRGGGNAPGGGNTRRRWQQQEGDDDAAAATAAAEPEGPSPVNAWRALGGFLKARCPGAEAWVLSGSADATRELGMRSSRKRSISLGGVKALWLKYEVRAARPGDGGDLPLEAGGHRKPGANDIAAVVRPRSAAALERAGGGDPGARRRRLVRAGATQP